LSRPSVQNIIEKEQIQTQDLFQKQLTSSQRHQLAAQLSEAQETHKDVLELQRSFLELHQMFQDFNNLIQEQEPLFDVIHENLLRAQGEILRGNQNIRDAKGYTITGMVQKMLPF
jgi:t-SNARE complex subunit (syntaxin)